MLELPVTILIADDYVWCFLMTQLNNNEILKLGKL